MFIFATTCDAASSASPAAVGMRGRVSGDEGSPLWRRRQGSFRGGGKDVLHDNGFYIRRLMLPVGEFVPGWAEGLSTDAPSLYGVVPVRGRR